MMDYSITRSFFLNKKTYNLLHTIYKKSQELYKTLYDDYLSMGNFTELILYIYITDNTEKKKEGVYMKTFIVIMATVILGILIWGLILGPGENFSSSLLAIFC